MNNRKKETVNIVTNEAIRGKPYLDIDRVIIEEKRPASNQKRED